MIIACGGNARVGKNLFASLLKERLGCNWVADALAHDLKQETKSFLNREFRLDPFSEDTNEKNQFRDFLVWYGNLKRTNTMGQYWIEKINKRIEQNEKQNVNTIITDLRFAQYIGSDEVDWVKKNNGIIVYIETYRYVNGQKVFIPPANKHEEENNIKIATTADYIVSWEFAGRDLNKLEPYITRFTDWLEVEKGVKSVLS